MQYLRCLHALRRWLRNPRVIAALIGGIVALAFASALDHSTRPHMYYSSQQVLEQTAGKPANFRVAVKLMHFADVKRAYPQLCCGTSTHDTDVVWVVAVAHGFSFSCPCCVPCDWSKLNWGLAVLWDGPDSQRRVVQTAGTNGEHWPPRFDTLPDMSVPFGGLLDRA